MKRTLVIAAATVCIGASAAQAEIYKWVDADGTVHYGDQPRRGAKPADLPDVYRADPIATPDRRVKNSQATGFSGMVKGMRITSPQTEQTFRDAQGQVNVQVSVDPGLPENATIRYFVDGNPVATEGTRANSIRVDGVTPGSHTVSASVLVNGSEVARAKPVVFYMRQPTSIKPLQGSGGGGETPAPGTASAPAATQSRGVLGAPRASAP